MQITVTGKHLDVGDSLKSHVEQEIAQMVGKYFGDIPEVHVNFSKANLSKDNFNFMTELSFHIGRHLTVHTRSEDADPYRSFGLALEKMDSRVKRYKSRLRVKKRHDAADRETIPAFDYVIRGDASDSDMEMGENPAIIAEMDIRIPTFSVSDAVMHMDLADQPMMMFRNAGNGHFNVVYRRPDGNIGWIDPSKQTN